MALEKARANDKDPYALEKAIVQHCDCNPDWPVCLYDFTLRNLISDQLVLSVPQLDLHIIDNYYDMSDYEKSGQKGGPPGTIRLYRGFHICSSAFVQNFRFQFTRKYTSVAKGSLGLLFENNLIPGCTMISQPSSLLRLL